MVRTFDNLLASYSVWYITNVDQTKPRQYSSYLRSWLGIPISGTLNIITLTKRKFGLNVIMTSTKFTQCQVTFRQSLNHSVNADLRRIYNETKKDTNIQYDTYCSSRDAIKSIRDKTLSNISSKLTTQKLVISVIWDWWQIYLIKHLIKSLKLYTVLLLVILSKCFKWKISPSPNCLHCHNQQTLGHLLLEAAR